LCTTASSSAHRAHSLPKCVNKAFFKIFIFGSKTGVLNLNKVLEGLYYFIAVAASRLLKYKKYNKLRYKKYNKHYNNLF
jgi:hypothetical protein